MKRPRNSHNEVHLAFPGEDDDRPDWRPRHAYARRNGLVVTNSTAGWVISHEASGRGIGTWPDYAKALTALEALAWLCDWTVAHPTTAGLRDLVLGVVECSGGVRDFVRDDRSRLSEVAPKPAQTWAVVDADRGYTADGKPWARDTIDTFDSKGAADLFATHGGRVALLVEQSPAAAKELRALRALARAAEKFERAGFPLGRLRVEFVEAVERMRRQSEGVAR